MQTLGEFLKENGWKEPVIVPFEKWLKARYDYNGNGTIDKGKEQRAYQKAIKDKNAQFDFQAAYQSDVDMIKANANERYLRLVEIFNQKTAGETSAVEANNAAKEIAQEQKQETNASNAAANVTTGNNQTYLIIAVVAVAALLLLKK